jgi:hypothetical protein
MCRFDMTYYSILLLLGCVSGWLLLDGLMALIDWWSQR